MSVSSAIEDLKEAMSTLIVVTNMAQHALLPKVDGEPLTATEAADWLRGHACQNDRDWPTLAMVAEAFYLLDPDEQQFACQRYALQGSSVQSALRRLPPRRYPEVIQEVQAVASLGSSFAHSFQWLVWHAESEALFVTDDPVAMCRYLEDGADDVTGSQKMWDRYYAASGITKVIEEDEL